MAHALKHHCHKASWLEAADEVVQTAPKPDVYRHVPSTDASVESLRTVAGTIRLKRPVPAWDVFEDDDDTE